MDHNNNDDNPNFNYNNFNNYNNYNNTTTTQPFEFNTKSSNQQFPPYSSQHTDEVYDFLSSLGLERYRTAFSQAEVNSLTTLSKLTADDLSEIGIATGPKRQILDAINGWAPSQSNRNVGGGGVGEGEGEGEGVYGRNVVLQQQQQFSASGTPTASSSFPPHGQKQGVFEKTTRPWFWCLYAAAFSLPFPFFCFGLVFCFMGHTRHYKFDNDMTKFEYKQHRGMCCYNLDAEDTQYPYSEIEKIVVRINSAVRINGMIGGAVDVVTRDGRTFCISGLMSTYIQAKEDAKSLSEFTGLPCAESNPGGNVILMY